MSKSFARVQEFVIAKDMKGAIMAASKSSKLGKHRGQILDAHMAYTNPGFLIQLKKDPELMKQLGHEAVMQLLADVS